MGVLIRDQMLILFAILAIGSWIGHLSIRGMALGTAGVERRASVDDSACLAAIPEEVSARTYRP